MINLQEKHILKAISETTPYPLGTCIDVYLCVASFDSTLDVLNKCSQTGMSVSQYLEGYRSIMSKPIIIKKQSLIKKLINWIKKQLN